MSTQLSSVDSFIDRAAKEFTFGLKAIAERPLWGIAAEKPPRPEFCRNCVAVKGFTGFSNSPKIDVVALPAVGIAPTTKAKLLWHTLTVNGQGEFGGFAEAGEVCLNLGSVQLRPDDVRVTEDGR